MADLSRTGEYAITEEMKKNMESFTGGFATQEEDGAMIRKLFKEVGYLMDTHTGVAAAVYQQYKEKTGDTAKTVIASTASPYKFSRSVMEAIGGPRETEDEFALIDEMSRLSGVPVPQAVEEIRTAPIRHNRECDVDGMKAEVRDILGI